MKFNSAFLSTANRGVAKQIADSNTDLMKLVSKRHQTLNFTLGTGGSVIVDLSSLGYKDFEIIPVVTVMPNNTRLITCTASSKDVSGTNRKVTLTGRRTKVGGAVTDLLNGLMENAVAGDVVTVQVIEL